MKTKKIILIAVAVVVVAGGGILVCRFTDQTQSHVRHC